MEFNINKIKRNVQHLVSLVKTNDIKSYMLSFLEKKMYTEKDLDALMNCLSRSLLEEDLTIPIAAAFEDCLLLLVTNALSDDNNAGEDVDTGFTRYQWKCIALSKLMQLSVCAKRYALSYFSNKPSPFSTSHDLVATKKSKKVVKDKPDSAAIIKCCYYLLKADVSYFTGLWNWTDFVQKYIDQSDGKTTILNIYLNHIVGMLTNMSASKIRKLNEGIPEEILIEFDEEQMALNLSNYNTLDDESNLLEDVSVEQTICLKDKYSSCVTNIEGVLLPIFNRNNYEFYSKTDGVHDSIVRVDSTKVNLRSIALGIAAGKAICLSGPVGCGKTTLVEYLARKTGRICPKKQEIADEEQTSLEVCKENYHRMENIHTVSTGIKRKSEISDSIKESLANGLTETPANGFLRIQLGDQTDCKMLLGQYHCTDVPGEFIWLPGVLTQAVMNGYWLLLEDLDCGTTDTFTVLSSLLENNYLSVPGFRDCVKITPGFQLFVTVRTHKSSSSNSTQKALFSLLEKYLYTINILPLSRNELCKVISTNYSKLSTVANRIVDVFLTFSSGDHDVADNLRQQETHDKANTTEHYTQLPYEEVNLTTVSNSGRLVSTRDLIKLCQRSNPAFSVTSTECAYFVFQNAVDVFCSYLPHSKEKTKLITSIGAKLGIIQSRCEHFAEEYKPEVQTDSERIKVGRAELYTRSAIEEATPLRERTEEQALKRLKLSNGERQISAKQKTAGVTFSFTRLASCLLERIAVCVANAEPVLLVGETGVGKTSSVQYLAARTKHKLVVVNMNNQSDVSDLVGGFKPVDLTYVIAPLRTEFELLFRQTFNQSKNESFLSKFSICYNQGNFAVIVKLMLKIVHSVFEKSERNELRDKDILLLPRWMALKIKLQKLCNQLSKSISISFAFIPGSLVNCIKNGDWVLLDEINLASAETLECLSTILEPDGSVVLLEKGDFTPVKRHPDFRIFACMNPNTDIGKKDLSVGIRNRFTEFFVDEVETESDLSLLISDYLSATGIQKKSVMNIVKLYKRLKLLAKLELNDGLGNRPVYSLRTLCRSLQICAKNLCGSIERNLYESFCLSFLTQLDPASHNVVQHLIKEAMLSNAKAALKQGIPKPGDGYLNFEGYWIQQGPKELQECSSYILTDSVKENLKDLSRIISIGKLPILLQGPTSAGKTSLIDYVARRSGNYCLRINNHEHTDLQEYIGTYTADISGKLAFKEGVLVQAMRNGYWIILDELNLASTEILEALNRVLDDNRELFIPETQTVVKAHPNFMLFATQNPPGLYGGRKTLSRAFKNRFIELHFSDIPRNELEIILEKKCLIPSSYAKKMVACMVDLQKNRKSTSKNVFTLRDLFRWGIRYTLADKKLLEDAKYDWNQHLIEEGYLVLSAKVRTEIELEIIEEALYKNFKKRIDLSVLFDANAAKPKSAVTKDIIEAIQNFKSRTDIVWTRNMSRMAVLTAKALQFDEPVLLVGPTGCGKTTVCQLLATIRGVNLRILNCHMHTEGADFLGGLRPCRQNEKDSKRLFEWADGPLIQSMLEGSYFMADEISLAEDSVLERLNCILEPERTVLLAEKCGVTTNEASENEVAKEFVVQANAGFQFLATMNPGGDFGKKELSPALRNRFTEIWCQPSDSREDLIHIASNCICDQLKDLSLDKRDILKIATFIVEIVLYMKTTIEKFKFSIRDILAMANYMVRNTTLSFPEKAIFGLETIFLDALEMSSQDSLEKVEALKSEIIEYAIQQADVIMCEKFTLGELLEKKGTTVVFTSEHTFGIKPFFINANIMTDDALLSTSKDFLFDAPTTKQNLFRLLSALSLEKPILLEGPPGVGKTSIVENLARAIGYNIVRINLCEHTDLADLFGTDLPAEDNILNSSSEANEEGQNKSHQIGSFQWRDGPLLAALKTDNSWILLDELNLAPQSVLEGLNAILDHRGEVYIPELNKTFALNKQTRIFASQNPLKQGGGRKGLPQSFLNRFTKVYVRKLTTEDLLHVVDGKYAATFNSLKQKFVSQLPLKYSENENLFDIYKSLKNRQPLLSSGDLYSSSDSIPSFDLSIRLVRFSELLDRGISTMEFGYKGGPFEINLRDILRWSELLISTQTGFTLKKTEFVENFDDFLLVLYEHMKLVYYQRMRCEQDKLFIRNAFSLIFQCEADYLNSLSEDVALYWTSEKIYVNDVVLERDTQPLRTRKPVECAPLLLGSQRETLKHIIECVHMEKPVLLCGSADTGKTKIIDALCCLSNQMCNSDNIDDSVTGSFQQIDLNRHLEEISHQVECIYLKFIQNAFLAKSNSNKTAIDLFDSWNKYSVLSNTKCELQNKSVVSEELTNYKRRIDRLHSVIEQLLNYLIDCSNAGEDKDDVKQLNDLQKQLIILKAHVKTADSLNTGGCFEWVDSKIVKSLKYGHYISLDHVNLCSSAVLDRLNPVFEPNGNLMISEKGVSDHEQTEIVEKAKNFRAFLTIDPKNGELSRAMRNRCVELSLNKSSMELDDKRILVYHHGIQDINAITSIIAIHESISTLTEINNFTISHLTQMAFLTASYQRIGYPMKRAIYVSAMEVYVYSATIDLMGYGLSYYQNKLREIVVTESENFAIAPKTIKNAYLQDAILNSTDLTEISMVKLQMIPIKIVLENMPESSCQQVSEALAQVFTGFKNLNMKEIIMKDFIKYLIYILFETSSIDDLRLRYLHLEKSLENKITLKSLSENLYKCVVDFELGSKGVLRSLPWNTKLYPRIRDYSADYLESLSNTSFCLSATLIVNMILQEIPQEAVAKLSQLNAITYSQAVAKKSLTDKMNNPFLQHFSEFLVHLENIMKSHLKLAKLNLESYTQLLTAIQWFNRILDVGKMKLYINKEINADLLDKLILHYKWMDKKLLTLVSNILPQIQEIAPEFHSSQKKLNSYVLSIKHPLNLRRKIYAKELIEFQPFYHDDQIKHFLATQQLDHLLRVIPLYGHFTAQDIINKFIAQNSDSTRRACATIFKDSTMPNFCKLNEINLKPSHGKYLPNELNIQLQQLASILRNESSTNITMSANDLEALEIELRTITQSLNSSQQNEESSLELPNEIELNLLAIREYFLTKSLITNTENPNISELLPINREYHEEIQFLNSTNMVLVNMLNLKDYQNYRDIWFKLSNYIDSIKDTAEFEELLKYLNAGYRHFSALHRLISNLISRLQLESLHTHPKCLRILRSKEDIQSLSTYDGPSFINTISSSIFSNDGSFKSVPLCDLDMWKNALEQQCQILWHNSVLMTQNFSILNNNYIASQRNATRLLLEVEYVEMLCEKVEHESSTDYTSGFRKLVSALKEQILEINDKSLINTHSSIENQAKLYKTSLTNSLIGCIELCLITFTPLIDPVEKKRLKSKYIADDIQCLSNITTAYDFTRITMKYKNLGKEIYESLEKNLQSLKERQNKFKEKVALRPEKCLYTNLVKDITHFLTTNCDPQVLFNFICSIQSTWIILTSKGQTNSNLGQSLDSCQEILSKLDLWIANSQRFVHHTLKPYSAYYQDFLQPLQCSIDQLRFGFEGLKVVLAQVKNCLLQHGTDTSYANINDNGKLHKVLRNIVEFPSNEMLSVFNINSSKDILQNRSPVFSVLNNVSGCESDYFHLLKAKLIELKNRVNISHHINQELFEEFDFAFNVINQIWQQEEERRRQKQKEDESLYLTKTKCQDENEELQELEEIDEMFPTTVQEDFGDFIQEDTLEKIMNLDRKKLLKTKKESTVVKDEDYALIAKTFIDILIKNTHAYYHPKQNRSDKTGRLEFIDYYKERLGVFVRLYNNYKSTVNDWLDDECFNSLYFSVAMQKNFLTEDLHTGVKQDKKPYNFYKDANIQEILSCTDVLARIEQRVDEQLTLYPEHATLVDIIRIIKRIRLLPSTASVVRFNTGFQILRQNVAQWNEVAHKNNHLKDEEQIVAEYVQKWTRLELQFWRNCLSNTYEKVESTAYKYWFFIYNLFHEYLAEREIDASLSDIKYTAKRFEEQEPFDHSEDHAKKFKVATNDILKILRQFVESSCYGDFSVRMQLLLAFELYLHNLVNYSQENALNSCNQIMDLISGLRNLQLYFEQFANEIEENKKSFKAPIEKKLKELVKIESYNKDLSYFSMRNNVARVHRNLNKFLKEYEHQLRQKITPVFQPKDSTAKDYNFANDKGKDLRYDSKMKYYMIDAKYYVVAQKLGNTPTEASNNEAHSLLSKAQRLFNTSRNVVKETVTNASYPKLIVGLDSLLAQQLERCDHLRNLTVDRSKERPKQKLEAKQILQQKRKGLTDLFKTLSMLGVNYKTGLMELSLRSEFEDLSLPPFCIKSMLSNFKEKRVQPKLLQLNENLDVYFNKCVFKLKLLQNIMLTPLSELGPPNIERIKGCAVDLFLLVQNQRRLLSSTSKTMYDFRVMLQQLRDIGEITSKPQVEESHMNFNQFRDRYNALKLVLAHIRYVFEQYQLFLSSAPSKRESTNTIFSNTNAAAMLQKSSTDFYTLTSQCESVLSLAKSTLVDLDKHNSEFVCKDRLDKYYDIYNQLFVTIASIIKCFKTSYNEYLPIAKPLVDLSTFIGNTIQVAFNEKNHKEPECDFENIDLELENVIHSMLLSLQKLYKKYPSKAQSDDEEKSPTKRKTEEEEYEEIHEQHLKKKLHEELKDDWNVMNIELLNEKLMNILLTVKLSKPSVDKINYIQKLLSVQPLLEQFNLMAEYYLCQQLGAHKVSVKMLSVILTVFVEIGTKGFCVPQDLMQDEEGESKKDQKEGEGFGLEDGTGEKDASDKIESEDQLDDAKRPEDRKDEQDKDENNECKEEKGIDMSDNFEGEMQDIEKKEDEEDDSGESENEEDMSKEMGETEEGAEKLDDQIWGDDEEPEQEEEEEEEKDMNEEDGKGNKDEQDSHNDLGSKNDTSKDEGKDEHEKDGLDATNEPSDEDKRKQQEKDIDEMKDQEQDQDQVNPYHNELEEPPEPEDFDLGDMNANDDNEENDEQPRDDNPFDIDTMKENLPDPEEPTENDQENNDEKEKAENEEHSSGDSDSEDDNQGELKEDTNAGADEAEQNGEEDNADEEDVDQQKRGEKEEENKEEEAQEENEENKREDKFEDYEQSKDESRKEDNMQSMPETETKGSKDQLQPEQTDKDVQQDQTLDEQDTGEEKDGVGQAENESNDGGHQGIAETKETITQEERKNEKHTKEKRKQGKTNEERSLGEAEKNKLKQLKTVDKLNDESDKQMDEDIPNDSEDKEMEADEYQHVKEPKTSDKLTLDNATEEQSKKIQHQEDEEMKEDDNDDGETNNNEMDLDDEAKTEEQTKEDLQEVSAEKLEKKSEKPSKSEKTNERAEAQEQLDIEGEIIPTMSVPRSEDTTAYCNKELLANNSGQAEELSAAKTLELRKMYQQQVTAQKPVLPQNEDHETWQNISNRMAQNARDLCEQLRLILEPTKCTRLKGDYRTGRRINMKKIIPYIASQFRKDKIWLRRTKPAQRDYKISIAIDDSKSMHHNNSKTLTLEAISLVSQALTLLESGRLSVLSFGEQPKILLNHTEQFDGPKLVSSLQFSQDKTKIAELLDFIRTVNVEEGSLDTDNGIFENLLLVLSDGRNIFSEGKTKVKNAIKLARLQRIFLVYIIIDNPENKNSILDIQTMEMLPDNRINIKSYLDNFPFPYYVIVRDLNQLPLVLSEAMRQWFELVSSEQ